MVRVCVCACVCVRACHQYRINMACTTLLRNTSWPQIPATLSPERWSRGWTMQFQDCWWTRSWSANLPSLPHWWRPQTAEKRFAVDATQLPQLRGSPTFDWKMLRPRMGSHQQHLQLPVPSGQVWPELKPIAMHMRWPLGTAHDRWTHDLLALLRSQQRCREQLGPQNSKCHSLQRPNRRKWWEHRLCLSIHLCTQLQLTSSSPFCQMGNEDHTGKCSSQVCSCKLCNCSTAWNLILRKFLMATWKRRLLRHSTTWAVKSVRKKTMELNHQEKPKTQRKPFSPRKPQENTKKNHEITKKSTLFTKKTIEKARKKTRTKFYPQEKMNLILLRKSRQRKLTPVVCGRAPIRAKWTIGSPGALRHLIPSCTGGAIQSNVTQILKPPRLSLCKIWINLLRKMPAMENAFATAMLV